MAIWDLNPVAFTLGPLEVRWYGLVYAAGFLFAYWILKRAAERKMVQGLTEKVAEDFIFWLMVMSIIGARLFHVLFYDPAYYATHLLDVLKVWEGGLSIHGGLLGAILVGVYFARRHRIRFYDLADILVVPLSFAFIFGKLTNYANAELWGDVTSVSWCVEFPYADGCRHPVQIYEALYGYAIFLSLVAMQESKRFARGVVFWMFMLLYGSMRFIVTFWREPEHGEAVIAGLSVGQWLSLLLVIIAAVWFFLHRRDILIKKHK